MGEQANKFLAAFNRVEKWMRDEVDAPNSMGFTELVRRLAKRKDLLVRRYQDDLIEIAQLRNAIVHDRISPDFVIAEPNDWIIAKLLKIEGNLTRPEKVIPRFKKQVTGFDKATKLTDILTIIAEKRYSQFPIYDQGKFLGLVTAHGLGIWMAMQDHETSIRINGQTVEVVLESDRKRNNYRFIDKETTVFQAIDFFLKDPTVEALLITKDGNPDGNLIGILRPKELFKDYYEEWGNLH